MSRTRVAALALVNWKGVFYERYLLDKHVTALEGANGAGKTTVMIAAYVALLPDMSRLRFTNLGESGATGGDRGIWGRLGEPGRPAYTALDLDLGGERLVVGVCLARTTEPTVEPTAFMISGLAERVRLSDVLLLRHQDGDQVPELAELKASVGRVGASIQVFRTIKEYFAALFERGVTPLRLTAEEDRNKWNDLLRTSMTGGISRALGTELRSFLLREESGLSDTLSRMRENLESCRRTRLEVVESRKLEREISAIYEAGLAMFSAALHAARASSAEAQEQVREATELIDRAQREQQVLSEQAVQLTQQEAELAERSEHTRNELAQLQAMKQQRQSVGLLRDRQTALDQELAAVEIQVQAALVVQRDQALARDAAKQARARTLEAYDQASMGLSNLQQGLAELARRAHAHKELQRCLQEARELLQRPELSPDEAADALGALSQQRAELERQRASLVRQGRDLETRRGEHASALAALDVLGQSTLLAQVAAEVGEVDPHARARLLLSRCAELEVGAARVQQLEQEQRAAERLAVRQRAARELAASLELSIDASDDPSVVVSNGLTQLEETQQAHEQLLHPDSAVLARRQRLGTLRQQLAALDQRASCYSLSRQAAQRLQDTGLTVPSESRADLLALRDRLVAEQLALQSRLDTLESERETLQAQAAELSRGGAVYDAELLRVRDELGAELLAARFEDLDSAQAGWVEARLGPWVDALVVDDLQAAAKLLSTLGHSLGTVHLVSADQSLELTPPDAVSGEVLVTQESYGARIARLPAPPSLGRRAREVKLTELREAIAGHAQAHEQVCAELQRNASQRRDADVLWTHAEVWLSSDPALSQRELEAELAAHEREEREYQQAQAAARTQLISLRRRAEGLRRLLPDAQLLGPPDHAQRAHELASTLRELGQARAELLRLAEARDDLSRLLDVLRSPPPDDVTLAEQASRLVALEAELDRSFRARTALEGALSLRYAAGFDDAQAALDAQSELSPALEQQQKSARAQLKAAEDAENTALSAWEEATGALQTVQAAKAALLAQRERTTAELMTLGDTDDERSVEALEQQLSAASAELGRLSDATRKCVTERALAEERHTRAQADVTKARSSQRAIAAGAEPLERSWLSLREAAESAGVLHSALSMPPPTLGSAAAQGSLQLRAEANSKRELLVDRVTRARGGDELADAIRDTDSYLDCWQAVRAWLGRRVPAQIAQVADPLMALERLRDHLDLLESRLNRQEGDLRGSSEDVARGIDVQLRRANSQVRRLNQHLLGIHFGSIHGIRIEIRRIERMEQILRALREGQAQELLFSSSLPIEEALDEIFKRYGGGGKSGGQRLLDYREYVELAVEIQRQGGAAWEPANPTRLSTGEAIGVGAALMMVVLTEWERDSNLLGARNKQGSLRFLFLDEANRLSRDNLGVLFDLCHTLDLQLLVAAPEVARADGNTTYRLVRHTTADGREEVIVSGRRAVSAAPATDDDESAEQGPEGSDVQTTPEPPAPVEPVEPHQLELAARR